MCLTQWIELAIAQCEKLAGSGKRGEGVDVNAAREILAVAKDDCRPEDRVIVVVVIGLRESVKCFGITTVEDLRPVHADKDNLSTARMVILASGDSGMSAIGPSALIFTMASLFAPPPARLPPGST
jgi:hypothetical protein